MKKEEYVDQRRLTLHDTPELPLVYDCSKILSAKGLRPVQVFGGIVDGATGILAGGFNFLNQLTGNVRP